MVVDDNTLAFLSFNDTSEPWKDECGNNWLTYGNPAANISKTVKQGTSGASLHCIGATTNIVNYIYLNTLKLGKHDFTIDFWVYIERINSGDDRILGTQLSVSSTSSNPMRFPFNVGTFQINGKISCYIPSQYLNTGVWTHRAMVFVYDENKIYYYINGTLIETVTTETASSYFSSQKYLYINIGCEEAGYISGAYSNFQGYIDNIRISNCARWTTNSFSTVDMYKFITYQTVYTKTRLINTKSVEIKSTLKYERRKIETVDFYTRFSYVFDNIKINNFVYRNVNISYELKNNTKRMHFFINENAIKRNVHVSSILNIYTYRIIKIHVIALLHHFNTCLKYNDITIINNNTCRYINIIERVSINTILSDYISNTVFINTIRNNIIDVVDEYIVSRNIFHKDAVFKYIIFRKVNIDILLEYLCERQILNEKYNNINITNRNVLKNIDLVIDFYRDILKDITFNTELYKNVLNDIKLNYFGCRNIIPNYSYNIDTIRNTHKAYKYNNIVVKNILNNIVLNLFSNRHVLSDSTSIDDSYTKRNVLVNINILQDNNINTKRNVLADISILQDNNINTKRNVLNSILLHICGKKNINKNFIYNTDTIKNILKDFVLINDSIRYIHYIFNIYNKSYRNVLNTLVLQDKSYRNILNDIVLQDKSYRSILNSIILKNNTIRSVNKNNYLYNNLCRYIQKNLSFTFAIKKIYTKDGWMTLSHTRVSHVFSVIVEINTQRYVHSYKKPVVAFVTNHKFKLSKNHKTQKQLLEQCMKFKNNRG